MSESQQEIACRCGPDFCAFNGHRWQPDGACKVRADLVAQLAFLEQELRGEIANCYSALRGEQGIELPTGEIVNVAELREKIADLEDTIYELRLGWD